MKKDFTIKQLTQNFINEEGAQFLYELNGKHGQIGSVLEKNNRRYLLFYKRDWFYKFSSYFPKFNCVGTGLSMKSINLADKMNAILVLFIGNKEYRIEGKLVKDFVEKNNTKKYYDVDNEVLGNIPSTFLERNMIVKKRVGYNYD